MCLPNDKSHVEAWKSLIDLSKTTISIASTVLTALIGFYVLRQSSFDTSGINYIAPGLLILSTLIAIYGFGRAIRAIKTGNSEVLGIVFINIAVVLLIIGISSIALIKFNKSASLDVVLSNIEIETRKLESKLSPKHMKRVEIINSNYFITYEIGIKTTNVTYSQKDNKIVKVE